MAEGRAGIKGKTAPERSKSRTAVSCASRAFTIRASRRICRRRVRRGWGGSLVFPVVAISCSRSHGLTSANGLCARYRGVRPKSSRAEDRHADRDRIVCDAQRACVVRSRAQEWRSIRLALAPWGSPRRRARRADQRTLRCRTTDSPGRSSGNHRGGFPGTDIRAARARFSRRRTLASLSRGRLQRSRTSLKASRRSTCASNARARRPSCTCTAPAVMGSGCA